jgi:hypothetical protein
MASETRQMTPIANSSSVERRHPVVTKVRQVENQRRIAVAPDDKRVAEWRARMNKTLPIIAALCLMPVMGHAAEPWAIRQIACAGNKREFTISCDLTTAVAYASLGGPPRPRSPYPTGSYEGHVQRIGNDLYFRGVINGVAWLAVIDPHVDRS